MAGIGLPYELGTGDMSQVNYSSWRGGMLGFRNTVEAYRWLTLIPLFCMPVWRRFIDTLILQGKIPQSAVNDPKIRSAQRAVDRAAVRVGRSGEGCRGGIEGRPHGPEDVVRGRAGERLRSHHAASADRAVQQAGGQVRDHPRFGPAQHHAARPGAAGRQPRSARRAARPLPASPRARASRRCRKRISAW